MSGGNIDTTRLRGLWNPLRKDSAGLLDQGVMQRLAQLEKDVEALNRRMDLFRDEEAKLSRETKQKLDGLDTAS